jgi:hypothetical protein
MEVEGGSLAISKEMGDKLDIFRYHKKVLVLRIII